MNNELIKVDPTQFGLEESKAAEIAAQFKPMLDKMVELEKEYNEVIALPVDKAATPARNLRIKYVKVRTGTEKIHKEQKAFYLAAGRFVDGWKNTQLFASQGIEKALEDIENYAANKEKERIAALQAERMELLKQYDVDGSQLQLGQMTDVIWNNFLTGTKSNYDAQKEAERVAEEQRLAAIEAERVRIEEQRLENERLKAEAEEREKVFAAEREAARLLEEQRQHELAEERRIAAEKLETERKAEAAKQAALKAEADRLSAELKKKQDAEAAETARLAKIEAERIAAEKKAAKAPVKEKMKVAVSALLLDLPNSDITPDILAKFNGFKQWALTQIESL